MTKCAFCGVLFGGPGWRVPRVTTPTVVAVDDTIRFEAVTERVTHYCSERCARSRSVFFANHGDTDDAD